MKSWFHEILSVRKARVTIRMSQEKIFLTCAGFAEMHSSVFLFAFLACVTGSNLPWPVPTRRPVLWTKGPDFSHAVEQAVGAQIADQLPSQDYMKVVSNVKGKLERNEPICESERVLWQGIRSEIRKSIQSEHCGEFEPQNGTWAACCHVRARCTDFGFCVFRGLLVNDPPVAQEYTCDFGLATSGRKLVPVSIQNSLSKLVRNTEEVLCFDGELCQFWSGNNRKD